MDRLVADLATLLRYALTGRGIEKRGLAAPAQRDTNCATMSVTVSANMTLRSFRQLDLDIRLGYQRIMNTAAEPVFFTVDSFHDSHQMQRSVGKPDFSSALPIFNIVLWDLKNR